MDGEDDLLKNDLVEDALDNKGVVAKGDDQEERRQTQMVHIQFQQRTVRKCICIIQGLSDDIDFKKLVRHFKKAFSCNATVIDDETYG